MPFLNVTPGTRSGIIHDERYAALCEACLCLQLEEHDLLRFSRTERVF